eukprot:CAMPEP_0185923750 /NCGR_PEP_ID=MMETSP0924C-20121207/11553_1 /TAXON_ID=321610 /ORGANISM="Perkinsus chesapeaki, Strain ATCC PRA-65" /LENGTH=62 /DNA_ID=CAMNT_0028657725 /DNA_START=70 /DNA_END=254 /DNA_ORIENTATION=-
MSPPLNHDDSSITFPDYDGLKKCTWKVGDGLTECPHHVFGKTSKSSAAGGGLKVNSALELVG